MGEINGITFENWAAACAHLAQGTPENEVIQVLGLEMPVWQDTNEQWGKKLGDLMAEDMNVATVYGEIFANPKVGKFASNDAVVKSGNDVLEIVPDWDTYQKIFFHMSVASEHGLDGAVILEEYGLDLGKWGAVGMEYMNKGINSVDSNAPDANEKFQYFSGIVQKWENHWKDFYKDNAIDLSDDIDF